MIDGRRVKCVKFVRILKSRLDFRMFEGLILDIELTTAVEATVGNLDKRL